MRIAILWPSLPSNDVAEMAYADIFCRRTTLEMLSQENDIVWIDYDDSPSLQGVRDVDQVSHILYICDQNLIITNQSLHRLIDVCETYSSPAIPVYNYSKSAAQQSVIPFSYDTIATFIELSDCISSGNSNIAYVDSDYDHGCIMIPVGLLPQNDSSVTLNELLRTIDGKIHIVKNALVHRFADYANVPRPELIDLIPTNISTALDIGCGKGQYGRLLQQTRPEIQVTGIEKSETLAEAASAYYSELIVGDFERMDLNRKVDLINCGDILEHLQDPWTALKRLYALLKRGGYLVVSIPNASHWSIVRELSRGQFDYLPAGLLCIGHLRWFTEKSFNGALSQTGLVTEKIVRHQPTPSPEGEQLIKLLSKLPDYDEQALRTHTLYFRAIKP